MSYKDEIYRRKYLKYRAKYEEMLSKRGGALEIDNILETITDYTTTKSANDVANAFKKFVENINSYGESDVGMISAVISKIKALPTKIDDKSQFTQIILGKLITKPDDFTTTQTELIKNLTESYNLLQIDSAEMTGSLDMIKELYERVNRVKDELKSINLEVPLGIFTIDRKEFIGKFADYKLRYDASVLGLEATINSLTSKTSITGTEAELELSMIKKNIEDLKEEKVIEQLEAQNKLFEEVFNLSTSNIDKFAENIVNALGNMKIYKDLSDNVTTSFAGYIGKKVKDLIDVIKQLKDYEKLFTSLEKTEDFKFTTYYHKIGKEIKNISDVKNEVKRKVMDIMNKGVQYFKNFLDMDSYNKKSKIEKDNIDSDIQVWLTLLNAEMSLNPRDFKSSLENSIKDLKENVENIVDSFQMLKDTLHKLKSKVKTGYTTDSQLNDIAEVILGHELGTDDSVEDSDSPIKVTVHYVKKPTISQIFIPQQVFMHQGFTPFDIVPRHHRKHHHRR